MSVAVTIQALEQYLNGNISQAKNLIEQDARPPGEQKIIDENNNLTEAGIEAFLQYYFLKGELKNVMLAALKNDGKICCGNSAILEKIKKLGLVDDKGYLSDMGYYKALESVPLNIQCKYLSLPVKELNLEKKNSEVELDVIDYYRARGWDGIHDEGATFNLMLRSLCIDAIIELMPDFKRGYLNVMLNSVRENLNIAPFPSNNVLASLKKIFDHENMPYYFHFGSLVSAYQRSIGEERRAKLLNSIKSTSKQKCLINAKKSLHWIQNENAIKPVIDLTIMDSLYSNLGIKKILNLANSMFVNNVCWIGWPDLTLIKGKEVVFGEVKIRDNLKYNQIESIGALRQNEIRVGVFKVERVGKNLWGCIEGDCINGRGTYVFFFKEDYKYNPKKYTGYFKEHNFHGDGILIMNDGGKYTGGFKDGTFHGKGAYSRPDGVKCSGEWKNGRLDGKSSLTLQGGDQYIGNFKNGHWFGKGVFINAAGNKTEGIWKGEEYPDWPALKKTKILIPTTINLKPGRMEISDIIYSLSDGWRNRLDDQTPNPIERELLPQMRLDPKSGKRGALLLC